MTEFYLQRSSAASDGGTDVAVGTTWTEVLDADDADAAVRFMLQNNSDTNIEVRLDDDGDVGIMLLAGPGGGLWDEDRYAGTVYARHTGVSGTKNLTRIIF